MHGLPMYLGYGGAPAGWAQVRLGDLSGGVAQMREGLDTLRTYGFTVVTPMFYPYFAELEAELSESNAALGTLDRALAEIERTEHRTFDAEVHRVRGEILLRSAPADTTPAGASLQGRNRDCPQTRRPQLRTAGRALAREALSNDRPRGAPTSSSRRRSKAFRRRRKCRRSPRHRRC